MRALASAVVVLATVCVHSWRNDNSLAYWSLVAWCLGVWRRLSTLNPSRNDAQLSYWCQRCDREVKGFDHHCFFLDLCVGEGNYRTFLVLVFSLALLQLTHFASSRNLASTISSAFLALALVSLLLFHAYLRLWLGTSTYGWVLRRSSSLDNSPPATSLSERKKREAQAAEYEHWLLEHKELVATSKPPHVGDQHQQQQICV